MSNANTVQKQVYAACNEILENDSPNGFPRQQIVKMAGKKLPFMDKADVKKYVYAYLSIAPIPSYIAEDFIESYIEKHGVSAMVVDIFNAMLEFAWQDSNNPPIGHLLLSAVTKARDSGMTEDAIYYTADFALNHKHANPFKLVKNDGGADNE